MTAIIAAQPGYRGILFDRVWDQGITKVVRVEVTVDEPIIAWQVPDDGSEPLPIGDGGWTYWHFLRPDGSVVEVGNKSWPDIAAFEAGVLSGDIKST
jgi:hypothetical protein